MPRMKSCEHLNWHHLYVQAYSIFLKKEKDDENGEKRSNFEKVLKTFYFHSKTGDNPIKEVCLKKG